MIAVRSLFALLTVLVLLSACGRKGAPRPVALLPAINRVFA